MPQSKKLLVAFDPIYPDASSSEFVIPWIVEDLTVFLGLKTKKQYALGMVVLTGRFVTANDLFARLIDSGVVIPKVADTVHSLEDYLIQIEALRIGNIARLGPTTKEGGPAFKLEVVANTPSAFRI